MCGFACLAGYGDCDGLAANGCEVNLNTSASNCGACGRTCATPANAVATCTSGMCGFACLAGYGNCDGSAANGCEANLNTDASNCGTCGTVCSAGYACVTGMCRPTNDTRATATTINLTAAFTTRSVDTTRARNDTTGTCGCTSGADVFYTFTLTAREIVYVDTFGSTRDTSLFFQDGAGANIASAGITPGATCNDDGGPLTCGSLQSQIVALLAAGTYYLVVSGCAAGPTTIQFQHLPAGNGTVASLAAGTTTTAGTTSGTGVIASTCCSSGPENTYFWFTCPAATGGAFTATTCTLATWDTELDQRSAARAPVSTCDDDGCGNQSAVSSTIPSGAGLNVLYVDGCLGSLGAYSVRVTRP
jgi:hypothetical protein